MQLPVLVLLFQRNSTKPLNFNMCAQKAAGTGLSTAPVVETKVIASLFSNHTVTLCTATYSMLLSSDTVCNGNPPSPLGGMFNCSEATLPGVECQGSCGSGYAGSFSATCLPSATWAEVTGACVPGTVPAVTAWICYVCSLHMHTQQPALFTKGEACTACL